MDLLEVMSPPVPARPFVLSIKPKTFFSSFFLQVGAGVDVLCKVRARPCAKAVSVMKAQLQEENDDAQKGEEGDEDHAPRAKRRRLAAFFVESDSSPAAVMEEGGSSIAKKEAPEVIVALRKGNIVGTSFHPELTNDSRWHEYFVRIVKEAVAASEGRSGQGEKPSAAKPAAVASAAIAEA